MTAEAFRARYGPWAAVLGAGQGIGRAFALRLAARGLAVLLVDVRDDLLARVRGEVEAQGVEARAARIDLGAPDAGEALAAALSGCDVGLGVHCAVRSLVGPFLATPLAAHREAVAVNVGGTLAACHVLGEALSRRGRGGLVVLSSLAAQQGTGWVAAYAAAKAFGQTLAEALWWELRPRGVDVLALVAGSTDTPGFRAHAPRVDAAALDDPEAVAEEGFAHLADGPLWICGETNRRIAEGVAGLSRAERVRLFSERTRGLYEAER